MPIEDHITHTPGGASRSSAVGTHSIETRVEFSWGWVEIRKYSWSAAVEDVWTLDRDLCIFNLALSPRPASTTIAHLSSAKQNVPSAGQSLKSIGRVLIIPPGSTVRVRAPMGKLHSLHCALRTDRIETIFHQKLDWSVGLVQEAVRFHGHDFEWMLNRMYQELTQIQFARELVAESFANILSAELVRCLQASQEKAASTRGGLAPWQMRAVHERVYCDALPPTLTELAELCGITVRHLGRAFKEATGQTIGKFVENAKIERAYSLLTGSSMQINEIAKQLGFASSASFAAAFRRATGFKPKEVQAQYRVYQ